MHSEDDESHEGLLREKTGAWEDIVVQQQFKHTRDVLIPWVLSIFFFCTTILFAWQSRTSPITQTCSNGNVNGTYGTGFSTDFASSSPPIPLNLIKKQFTNALHFNATSQELYNEPLDPNEVTYIGPPSPSIDAAWHDLLHDQYVAISASEAAQFPPEHRQLISYAGQESYYFELSVFHYLHCLNEIRIALEKSYSPAPPHSPARSPTSESNHRKRDSGGGAERIFESRAHTDHCIDQLRQAVQCHADLTPVPMRKVEGGPEGLVIGNTEGHVCRDFEAIRGWVRERGERIRALGD